MDPGTRFVKRSYILVLVAGVVAVVALTLRVNSRLNRPAVELRQHPATSAPALPPMPPDYVAAPVIDPAERERGPNRIVSLAPSITELVCALGLRDRLVGRTPYCRYPPGIESVPAVGALQDPNFEKIRSLSPDLVLITANSTRLASGLDELGVNYHRIPHETLDDVYAAIEATGEACDRPLTARRLTDALRADVRALHQWATQSVHHPQRVLIVLGEFPVPPRGVWAAGPGSFLGDLVNLAGHTNAAGRVLKVSHGEVPLTALRGLDPDVILTFGQPPTDRQRLDLYQSWSRIGPMRAIDRQRVRTVGDEEYLSAGPRIAVTLHGIIATMSEFDR